MISIAQSTAYVVVFKAYLASDHVTEATGKTIAITISKNGGAFGNPNAGATNATEISSGWYKFTLDTTDTGTLGPVAFRGAVATVDDVGSWVNVVSATTGGATNLDATVSSRASQTTLDTLDDFVDTEVGAIKTKTDFLPSATAGAAGGLFIAGTNAATVVTTSFTTTFTGNLTGSVASVTGAVGSVTGAVGSVTGAVGSVAAGGIVAATFAADAITAAKIAADVGTEIGTAVWATAARTLTANTNFNDPTTAAIADAVWDELIAGHAGAGSTGAALSAAGSAGDPWTTALPGAYGAGTAGKIVGDNLDAAVSSRLATAGYTAPPTANANADALLDRAAGIETGLTPRQGFRLFAAALLGKASGLATTTAVYRDTGDSKDRISATVDADGNRSAVTLDAS